MLEPLEDWASDHRHVCGAPLMMMDDHWGAVRQSCDLIAGHAGDHAAELRGCIPTAVLSWPQNDVHEPADKHSYEDVRS